MYLPIAAYAPLPATTRAWPWDCTDGGWYPTAYTGWLAEHAPDDGNADTGPVDVDWNGIGDAPAGSQTIGCLKVAELLGDPYARETAVAIPTVLNMMTMPYIAAAQMVNPDTGITIVPAGFLPDGLLQRTPDEVTRFLASFPKGCIYFPEGSGFQEGNRLWFNDVCMGDLSEEMDEICDGGVVIERRGDAAGNEPYTGLLTPNGVRTDVPPTLLCGELPPFIAFARTPTGPNRVSKLHACSGRARMTPDATASPVYAVPLHSDLKKRP